jgi:hypothetical protein
MHASDPTGASHNPSFSTVTWFGEEYHFSPPQARCVKVLWNFWKLGTPIIREEMVLEIANIPARALKDVFKTGPGKDAWGHMIDVGDRRGTVQLVQPQASAEPASTGASEPA